MDKKRSADLLELCKRAAVEAGEQIMAVYADEARFSQVEYKTDNSPLTEADKLSNKVIVDMLREAFPDYAILSEEEKDNLDRLNNEYCFVIDPLDGTKEFLKRNGQFTVNIALAYRHKSVLGVIYVPATGELYYAAQGMGSFLRDNAGNEKRLSVSKETDLSKVKLVMSSSHGCEEMDRLVEKYGFKNFARMGSSLKGCLIAKGEAEIYYRYNPTMEWDTAAMQCIVEEAGGIFRQMDDSEMLYNREDSLNSKGFYAINCMENRVK